MRISIITVVYNAVQTIEQTITSVLSQSYNDVEYIIIDGGSTDGTLDIIEKYREKLAYFISEPDNGIYDAMNKGITKATGEVVGLLNADDWYEPDALTIVGNAFKVSSVGVVFGNMQYIEKNGGKKYWEMRNLDELFIGMPIPHPATFVRNSIYKRYGYFDTRYHISADHEFILRLYINKVKFLQVDSCLTNFRTTGISSLEPFQSILEDNIILSKYLNFCPYKDLAINSLKERFFSFIFNSMIEKKPHIIMDILTKEYGLKDTIVIWGTGVWGGRISDFFIKSNISIPFFVDTDPEKRGSIFKGTKVVSPELLKTYHGIIFVAAKKSSSDIEKKLKSLHNTKIQWIIFDDFIKKFITLYKQLK